MPHAPTKIELYVPERDGKRIVISSVPFLSTTVPDGWEHDEGPLHWTVGGVELLGSFGLYPMNQIEAVLDILELAIARKSGRVVVGGSILTLSTRPLDGTGRFAHFGVERPHRNASGSLDQSEVERREVKAHVSEVARIVIATMRTWMHHLPSVPNPRPRSAPQQEPDLNPLALEVLPRLDRIERTIRH